MAKVGQQMRTRKENRQENKEMKQILQLKSKDRLTRLKIIFSCLLPSTNTRVQEVIQSQNMETNNTRTLYVLSHQGNASQDSIAIPFLLNQNGYYQENETGSNAAKNECGRKNPYALMPGI